MVLLCVATIVLAVRAKRLPVYLRWGLVATILLATAGDLIAVGYVMREPERHRQRFMAQEPIYTSGLHDALEAGDVDRVKAILDAKTVDTSHTDYEGCNLLHIAVKRSDRAMVEMLLRYDDANDPYGKWVNGRDNWDRTPLGWAVQTGNSEIVRLLLDRGARINQGDHDGKTPLAYAQESGKDAIAELLLARGAKPVDYERLIMEAAFAADKTRVERLLADGVSVNFKLPDGATLLHLGAETGEVDFAAFLLSKGAVLESMADRGTPLHSAAFSGRPEMVRFLISKGANPNAMTERNVTPLCRTLEYDDHFDTVRALLEGGANPNLGTLDGVSCLKFCVDHRRDAAVIELLRKHGAKE